MRLDVTAIVQVSNENFANIRLLPIQLMISDLNGIQVVFRPRANPCDFHWSTHVEGLRAQWGKFMWSWHIEGTDLDQICLFAVLTDDMQFHIANNILYVEKSNQDYVS